MEASPDNRLPEADSLPDGFVEGSADPSVPRSPPRHKDESVKVEQPGEPGGRIVDEGAEGPGKVLSGVDCGTVEPGVASEEAAESEKGALTGSEGERSTGSGYESSVRGSLDPDRGETEGLALHTSQANERSTTEPVGPKNKKDSLEAKRKVVKRGTKQEQELLELTLNYQKVIAERDAAVALRVKLESLCRELQRQNKMLMEECQRVSTEGQNIRSDLSARFNNVIKEVSSKLEEQKDECLSQLKENEMLRDKLKHLADQYAISEQHFSQKLKQKSLELQIAELKVQQHEEKSSQEQAQMQLYLEQVKQLLETEKSLRSQLAADGEKFQQFQDALVKSNEVFETFKQEMEKMAKLIKDLKKENVFLKSKCEKSDFSLVKLVEEREHTKIQMEKLKNQKEKLESLCRSLQAKRKQKLISGSSSEIVAVETKIAPPTEES